jgi:hypothetical protein
MPTCCFSDRDPSYQEYKVCECTMEDFECDYGWTRPDNSSICEEDASYHIPDTVACGEVQENSSGYVRIPGDRCKGGLEETLAPRDKTHVCPPPAKKEPAPVNAAAIVVPIVVVVIALIAVGVVAFFFIRKRRGRVNLPSLRYTRVDQQDTLLGDMDGADFEPNDEMDDDALDTDDRLLTL